MPGLRVVRKCPCGDRFCHTVEFAREGSGDVSLLVDHYTEDRRLLLIFANEESGEIAELEII